MSKPNPQRETLSAMLDDEADELELRRLLKASADNPDLQRAWERYNLAGAVLRGERTAPLSEDFHLQVASRLRDEAAPGQSLRFGTSRRLAGRFAIAATVAVAVFIGLQSGLDTDLAAPQIAGEAAEVIAPNALESQAADALPQTPETQAVEVATALATPVDPEARQRLLEYIESMRFDPTEPPRMEHIEDSPLFHLVNDLQD